MFYNELIIIGDIMDKSILTKIQEKIIILTFLEKTNPNISMNSKEQWTKLHSQALNMTYEEDSSVVSLFFTQMQTICTSFENQKTVYNCCNDWKSYLSLQEASQNKIKRCSCGAKHTSTPKFHFDWCDHPY